MTNGLLIPTINKTVSASIRSLSPRNEGFQAKGRRSARIALIKMGYSAEQVEKVLFDMGYRK